MFSTPIRAGRRVEPPTLGSGVEPRRRPILIETSGFGIVTAHGPQTCAFDGVVEAIEVRAGDQVAEGSLLALIRKGE
jgi:multidrug efflux pump subunit AcrA (membrane-fusion protein)